MAHVRTKHLAGAVNAADNHTALLHIGSDLSYAVLPCLTNLIEVSALFSSPMEVLQDKEVEWLVENDYQLLRTK